MAGAPEEKGSVPRLSSIRGPSGGGPCNQRSSESDEDGLATRHFDGFRNRWFFDPVFGRGYPEDMIRAYSLRGRWDPHIVKPGDLETIGGGIDFLGLNYYTTIDMSAGREETEDGEVAPGPDPPAGYTEMGSRIDPHGFRRYLDHIHTTYRPTSILITENGASYSDGPNSQGVVNDQRRIDYLDLNLRSLAEARSSGVPIDGYFVWSLLDNLEWISGFSQRYGLVWTDFDTGRRIPKRSFDWYSQVARTGTLPDK